MSKVHRFGDQLAVTLSNANNFNTTNDNIALNPPIIGQEYFRILSNHVVEIYCSFAKTTSVLKADGTILETKQIIAGLEDTWYKCMDKHIILPIVYLVSPDKSNFNNIDILFQFIDTVPSDYLFTV